MIRSEQRIHTIYDRIGKRCLSLSKRSTVQLINGLYNKNYPEDSEVEYNWTEHHDDDLKRTLADAIIRIDHRDSYHVEMQMTIDEEIILRVFEYGFGHAMKSRNQHEYELHFPCPLVVYLCEAERTPDELKLMIVFEGQGTFEYKVPVIKFQQIPLEELKKRKLIALLPFQILRLRKVIDKARSPENMEALKTLIFRDIMGSIHENEEAGNLSWAEASKLVEMTLKLYEHIYRQYVELEEVGMNDMVEDALVLEMDRFEKRINELILRADKMEQIAEEMEQKAEEMEQKAEEMEQKAEEMEQKAEEMEQKAVWLEQRNDVLEKQNQVFQMILQGKSDDEIVTCTGMSRTQIEELRK